MSECFILATLIYMVKLISKHKHDSDDKPYELELEEAQ